MLDERELQKQFYYECANQLRTATCKMCQRYALSNFKVSIEPESTIDEYNNYELLKIFVQWREGDRRCSLARIVNTHEIHDSPFRQSIIDCHVKILNQQIQAHLDGKIQE